MADGHAPEGTVEPVNAASDDIITLVHHAASEHARDNPDDRQHLAPLVTVTERRNLGRAQRHACGREHLGDWQPRCNSDTALDILHQQETARVPSLLPLRHARMAASPFAFYRGSAAVFAHDTAPTNHSGLTVQLCGDAHMLNFGLFAGSDRNVVFDINDFDETHPGPFEWDLKRLLVSIVLAGQERHLDTTAIAEAVDAAADQYHHSINHYSRLDNLSIWYSRTTITDLITYTRQHRRKGLEEAIAAAINEAQRKNMWSAVAKFTTDTPNGRIFRHQPPALIRIPMDDTVATNIENLYEEYKTTLPSERGRLLDRYRIIDIGHKVVGVGSVGLLAFVTLLQGRDEHDLLVLQAKQAVASVLEPYTAPSAYPQPGQRVVAGQHLMQADSDQFLGWYAGREGRSFYMRQLRDMKGSIDLNGLTGRVLTSYGALCAATLARAHARSGDPVAIAAYLGDSDKAARALSTFAFTYSEQVHRDWTAYVAAHANETP